MLGKHTYHRLGDLQEQKPISPTLGWSPRWRCQHEVPVRAVSSQGRATRGSSAPSTRAVSGLTSWGAHFPPPWKAFRSRHNPDLNCSITVNSEDIKKKSWVRPVIPAIPEAEARRSQIHSRPDWMTQSVQGQPEQLTKSVSQRDS